MEKSDQKPRRSKIVSKSKVVFITQNTRKDVLHNILNSTINAKDLYELIMSDSASESSSDSRKGWLFETLCQILALSKCIKGLHYTEFYEGQLQNLHKVKSIQSLLDIKVEGGGNNIVDLVLKINDTLLLFSIKHKKKYGETDVCKIDTTMTTQKITDNYKIALIVKDKDLILQHKYKNDANIDKQLHDTIISNKLLFDENDIINALDIFCKRFGNISVEDFVELINTDYLSSPRQQLVEKLHQRLSLLKFIKCLKDKSALQKFMYMISHKPRSGKSITILLICKYLLENGYNNILIMTSVPATIDSFVNDLKQYIDFKDIKYLLQSGIGKTDMDMDTFTGITFCSVQYLKSDKSGKKKNFLKKMNYDAIITDESHQGSSTNKTKEEILDIEPNVEEIRKMIKLNIFASGTPDKTIRHYKIPLSCVDVWEIEDESSMKSLTKPSKDVFDYMINRHSILFIKCFEDNTLNRDYSKHPTQVFMKGRISSKLIDEINEYNSVHGTKYGYSCSSLFALSKKKIKDSSGNDSYEYDESF